MRTVPGPTEPPVAPRPTLTALFDDAVRRHPQRAALRAGEVQLSYRQLDQAANQVANLLRASGVERGDAVALSCPNLPQFTVAYYGILKTGGTVVPLNVLLKPREIAYHLADSGARCLLAYEGTAALPVGEWAALGFADASSCTSLHLMPHRLDQAPWSDQPTTFSAVPPDADDTAVILYTSGTTGSPKGAELSHSNLALNALTSTEIFAMDSRRPDTFLCVLPLYHSFGQTCVQNAAIACGGTIVLMPRFEAADALDLMARERVTFFAGVPTMYWGLLGVDADPTRDGSIRERLRIAVSGGAALPGEIHKDFGRRFGVSILEGYGLTETSPIASFAVAGDEPRIGSVGRPIRGVEMKLLRPDGSEVGNDPDLVGEVAIRGHNVMKGYHDRPEATAEAIRDGWFRSGDLARRDSDGYYYIVDRKKDMIIRGGYNVYPRELEDVLMTHPAVSLVAVVGVPHDSLGEEVKAFIQKHAGDDTSEDEIRSWAREQLAAYKYPRIVEFVDSFPTTSTGKILKRALS